MRRSVRATTLRLAAIAFAALVAVPSVAAAPAAPVPSAPTTTAAPSPRISGTIKAPRLVRTGTVDPKTIRASKRDTRPRVNLPRLGTPLKAGPSGATPRVAGPRAATVPVAPVAHLPIAGPVFAGQTYGAGTATGVEPPDPYLAAGPDHIIQVVNTQMRVMNRQGVLAQADRSLADFFNLPFPPTGPETFNADPRVIYDSLHGRWLMSELSFDCDGDPTANFEEGRFGHGFIDFAISDTADPTLSWTLFGFGFDDYLPDFPGLGTSTDKVAFSANFFPFGNDLCDDTTFGSFNSSVLYVVDWAQLMAAGPSGNANIRVVDPDALLRGLGDPPVTFTPRPTVQSPATSATIYGVAWMDPDGHVMYFTVTGSVPLNNLQFTSTDVTATGPGVPAFGDPPDPRQPGPNSPLAGAIDGRPTDAVWQDNRLVFVATTSCTPVGDTAPRDCVRVAELNTGVTPVSQRQDFWVTEVAKDLFFGGVGLSLNGTLHVTYSQSSLTEFIQGWARYQLNNPADVNTLSTPPELVLSSTNQYTIGDRWGDYLGVGTDPQAPGAVWRTNQAANSSGAWTTNLGILNTDFGSTYVPITPLRVLDTRTPLGVPGNFLSGVPQSFQITGKGAPPIPASAVAITGNVAIFNQTAAGYIAVTPRPTSKPPSSTTNFPVGDTRANNVTLPIGPGGKIAAVYITGTTGKTTGMVFDVTGYFMPTDTEAVYNTLTPARILDTRPGFDIGLSSTFKRDVPRSVTVWGRGGVPGDPDGPGPLPGPIAVTGNLTVVGQNGAGHVDLSPNPNPPPPVASTINFPVGDARANGVTIQLSAAGQFSAVYRTATAGASTHLLFDVTGYYQIGVSGLKFFPLSPGRILDTRPGVALSGLTGTFAGENASSGTARTLHTTGHQGIPLAARAITGNLTDVLPTSAGYLSIRLSAGDPETTSTINFPVRDTRANGVTVPVTNPGGDMVIHYHTSGGGTVHVLLDVTGYFAPLVP